MSSKKKRGSRRQGNPSNNIERKEQETTNVRTAQRTAKDTRKSGAMLPRTKVLTLVVLLVSIVLFIACALMLRTKKTDSEAEEYSEYERATVTAVQSDNTELDPVSDNAYRGEQMLIATVETGRYQGESLQVYNYVGPIYGMPVKEGDSIVIIISTYENGDHTATVFEYNRFYPLLIVLALFFLVTILVGRGTGAKSLAALFITVLSLFMVLLPALMKGAPTIPTTLLVAVYITIVSLTIIGGIQKKTICAMLGTIAGTTIAALFGLFAQTILRIDGLRMTDVEALLQLRQTGESTLGLKGLLVAGVIVSAIGAVMDVAMSISSALTEVHEANPSYGWKDLFRSGMNIGHDMVGTMTNTLILAFLGSGFTLILYLYSLGLSFWQLTASAYVSLEVISSIACSIGLILAIPLTAMVTAWVLARENKQ